MLHKVPVKTLGEAPYDFTDLTDQQKLSDFWRNPMSPNDNVYQSYRDYLLWKTQLNSSFYISKASQKNIQCSTLKSADVSPHVSIGNM